METRPFLKRLLAPFLKRKPKLSQPEPTSHVFPLSPPKTNERVVRVRRRRRGLYRPQPPSNDQRFNHALRPSHIARARAKAIDIDRIVL